MSTSRQLKRIESNLKSPIFSFFAETLTGVSTISAFGRKKTFADKLEDLVDQHQRAFYPSIVANREIFTSSFLKSNTLLKISINERTNLLLKYLK